MDRIIRIDVSTPGGPTATEEPIGRYGGYGGRALTTAILHNEIDPLCHALGGKNKLVIAPGLMAGSAARTSCRLSVGCKSPLTRAINGANAGGQSSHHLGLLNIAGIIIEGAPATSSLYKIVISQGATVIEPADDLAGLTNNTLCDQLMKVHGNTVSVISIGPAGEWKMVNATIAVTDSNSRPSCHAHRGGVGAVMGAKRIKCIVIDPAGTSPRAPADLERFQKANQAFISGLHHHDYSGRKLPACDTVLTRILTGAGGCPAFNARAVGLLDQKDSVVKYIPDNNLPDNGKRQRIQACSIKCTGEYLDKDDNYVFKAPSGEAIWAFGQHCGIRDMNAISELSHLVDDYGFDCIGLGGAIRIAMEASIIEYGDAEGTMRLVKEAGEATYLGRILGNGADTAVRCFGINPPAPNDPIAPASEHDSTSALRLLQGLDMAYALSMQQLHFPNTMETKDGLDMVRNLEIAIAVLDSLGFCLFSVFAILDQPETLNAMVEIINGMFDLKLTDNDIVKLGKMVVRMEHEFNAKAGITRVHDRLPSMFAQEFLASHHIALEFLGKVTAFTS